MNEKIQKVIAFQQRNSGLEKIRGIFEQGKEIIHLERVDIDEVFPPVIDDSTGILPQTLDCDLVLNFLTHPDLSSDLVKLCKKLQIPVISSGQKLTESWGETPVTCCGLLPNSKLGNYGKHFGMPEFSVKTAEGIITEITVERGAPCAATWRAAEKIIGESVEDACRIMGLQTQFFCHANPAGWDPINGKSPVHFAGKVHAKALEKAIDFSLKNK